MVKITPQILAESKRKPKIKVETPPVRLDKNLPGPTPEDEGAHTQIIKDNHGRLLQTVTMKNHKPHGPYTVYYADTGHVRQSMYFENGLLSGPMKTYDQDKSLTHEMIFAHGKMDGICTSYKNGNKRLEAGYKTGQQDGETKFYDKTGVLTAIAQYTHGQLDGPFIFYDKHKKIIKKSHYVSGLLEGEEVSYFPESYKLLKKAIYKKGLPVGEVESFYENGHFREVDTYKDGKIVQKILYDQKGHVHKTEKYDIKEVAAPPSAPMAPHISSSRLKTT